MNKKISIVITIRITENLFEPEERILTLCSQIPLDLFEIVVVDYGTAPSRAEVLAKLTSSGVNVIRHPRPSKIFSIGDARDFGAQNSNYSVVLFLDIDFYADENIFRNIYDFAYDENIFQDKKKFFCIPVMFLTEEGTSSYIENLNFLKNENLLKIEELKNIVDFPSYGSSAIILNRDHYLSIGGHHKKFKGHGAEDFELLHRLSSIFPFGERPINYYSDKKIKNFEPFLGFRPYFAKYSIPPLSKSAFLIHRYHPRRKEAGYFRRRRNFFLLALLMRWFDKYEKYPLPLVNLLSNHRVLVCLKSDDKDFNKCRSILAKSSFYLLESENKLSCKKKLEYIIKSHNLTQVVLRGSDYSPKRAKLQMEMEKLGLEIVVV